MLVLFRLLSRSMKSFGIQRSLEFSLSHPICMQLTADDDAKAWLGPSHVLQIKIRPQVSRTIINTKRRRKCLIKIGNALMPSEGTYIYQCYQLLLFLRICTFEFLSCIKVNFWLTQIIMFGSERLMFVCSCLYWNSRRWSSSKEGKNVK